MKKKFILAGSLVLAAVIAAALFYIFAPITFRQGVGNIKTEDIVKIQLLDGTAGTLTETTDPQLIEEIYTELAPVKLDWKRPVQAAGWSWGVKLYTGEPDDFVFYTCDHDFLKFGSYAGHVRGGAWYTDTSQTVRQTIIKYYQMLAEAQGEQPIAPPG